MIERAFSGSYALSLVREATRRHGKKRLTRGARKRRIRRVVGGAIVATALLSAIMVLGTIARDLFRPQ